jgi:hypothetical protein
MAYTLEGTYVAVCNCRGLCPCPVDGPPTAEGGECYGALSFAVRQGNLDGTDLSGASFTLYNHFPSNLTSGNWRVGIVVDDGASDEQAQALERIVTGEEGGPFGEFVPFIGEYEGMRRGPVSVTGGENPSTSVGGVGDDLSIELYRGPDGAPTTVSNAMFGFAPTYRVGKGSGRYEVFGSTYEGQYGETTDFLFSTDMPEGSIRPRA